MSDFKIRFVLFACVSLSVGFSTASAEGWDTMLKLYDQKNMYPKDAANGSTPGYYKWINCMKPETDHQPVASRKGVLLEECQPDVLYSWGGSNKKAEFKKNATGKQWATKFTKAIFAHINPLATFGYGGLNIRMKLKPGTKFLLYTRNDIQNSQFCPTLLKKEQWQNTIIVRSWVNYNLSGVDYVLCSPGPIHSWSINTKKHFDEIAVSQKWNINQADSHGWIPYTRSYGAAQLYDSGLDGQDWSADRMYGNLASMRDYIKKGKSEIHYNPAVTVDENFHFATAKPIYWNTQRYVAPPAPAKPVEGAPTAPGQPVTPTPPAAGSVPAVPAVPAAPAVPAQPSAPAAPPTPAAAPVAPTLPQAQPDAPTSVPQGYRQAD